MEQSELSNYLTDEESIKTRTALFNKYVYPYRNLIYHICIKNTAAEDDIRDNYNEVLLNFYKYVCTYDPSRSVKTWIYAVTSRCIFDLESKRHRFRRTGEVGCVDIEQLSDELLDEDELSGNCISLDNYQELFSDEVLCALQMLKPMYRDPLLLQVSGYKLDEITEMLHKQGSLKAPNIETTKSRIFLAKKQLRELLTRDGKRKKRESNG